MQRFKLRVRCSVEAPGKLVLTLLPIIVALVIELVRSIVHR